MRKIRENKALIKTEMQQSQSLFPESSVVIGAGISQTRFNRNENMRFQDTMQGKNSYPPNHQLKKYIYLGFNQQISVPQKYQATINQQHQPSFWRCVSRVWKRFCVSNGSSSFFLKARTLFLTQIFPHLVPIMCQPQDSPPQSITLM